MKRVVKIAGLIVVSFALGLFLYGALGYWDAINEADKYIARADALINDGHGPDSLGNERLEQLLMVQDPSFWDHSGVDLLTAGAGLTTVSQSLAKRLGFEEFQPGIGKIRQTGFAIGLESRLSKDQILALFLETVEMGRGPNGWITGFYKASMDVYGQSPLEIANHDFLKLVAVMISPAKYDLTQDDDSLMDRTSRIARLVRDDCTPNGLQDVWLEGCS